MNRLTFLKFWNLAVGAMDACTGILLVTAPATALRLMNVPPVHPATGVFLSWMGVFIGTVGLSYVLVLRGRREGETVWIFTAAVRSLVAVFLVVRISAGDLHTAWSLVAATDGLVAAGQWIILRAGWWKGASE